MNKQMELAVLADCSFEIKDLPYKDVARCSTIHEAFHLCKTNSIVWRSEDTWAELLGVSKGYFNQVLNGGSPNKPRHMGWDIRSGLQKLAGNRAIVQWEDLELKGQLFCQLNTKTREQELLEELAELRQQA